MSEENKRPFITGKVEEIGETLAIGASGFTKRDLIVETGYKFPNPLKVTLKKDATALADDLNVGDIVRVEYALDGRKWDGPNGTRYFVDIVGMKVEKIKTAASTAVAGAAQAANGTATCQQAVETWAKYHGDDKAAFAAFCKAQKPGKASKAYTPTDWGEIVAKIESEAAGNTGDQFTEDEMPF